MTVPYILHCMLEQVVTYEAPLNPPPTRQNSETSQVVIPILEHRNTNPEVFLMEQLRVLEEHYGLSKCEVYDQQIKSKLFSLVPVLKCIR